MDLDPNDDQRALQEMISRFAADRFPSEVTRSFGEPGGFDRVAWRELADLGTFGISLPESAGGVGLGTIESVLVHESLGAALVPGPLLAATLAAGLIPGVLEGDVVPAIVTRPDHRVALVEHLQNADVLLVIDDMGIELVDVAAIDGRIVEHPTDPTTPVTIGYATSNGTATAGTDYTATTGTLTFAPGVTSQQITVPILADTAVEAGETFTVTLSNPSGATLTTATATGTITNTAVTVTPPPTATPSSPRSTPTTRSPTLARRGRAAARRSTSST